MTREGLHTKSREYGAAYAKAYRSGYRVRVPSFGSRRRVQALMAIGYTIGEISQETDIPEATLGKLILDPRKYYSPKQIPAERAAVIREVYERYWLKPKNDTPGASKVRKHAARMRYAPPLAWDDIDNPHERPKGALYGRDVRDVA